MDNNNSENRPECFGVLELVFPMSENGLRETPEVCMACRHKVECLKTAIKQDDGLRVEDEKVDRAYQAGKITFFERWAKKKSIHLRKHKDSGAGGKS
ncbi:MAG: hypothetical protein K9J85_09775 [Desulfobacteraceae bacterium]|nr:hypothetical protein [Desulfobacteraceae bacterium]